MPNKDLIDILRKKSKGVELLRKIDIIKEKASPLLDRILITYPEYTTHNILHSEAVLTRINDLIPSNLKEELKSYEIFFLIASAYLHDIGMAELDYFGIPQDIKSNKEKLEEYIRDNHHKRAEEFISKNYDHFGISNLNQAQIIGRICRGHRKESLDDSSIFDSKQTYENQIINIPFLASVLRVSDELDLTFERIPLVVYEMGLINSPTSKKEWKKHLSVDGVTKDPDCPEILRCTAKCDDPEIHRMLKAIEKKINLQLEGLHYYLHHYRKFSKDLPWKFILRITVSGYKYYDFKFSLKQNEILKLLIGEGLYERKEESIRELLKNCVDTCRLNSIKLKKEGSDDSYHPRIFFELTPSRDKLSVSDNGIGMDEYIIDNYFTKIGKSFYRSPDFLEENYNFSPLSELGIGFLSSFLIADEVNIETKTIESDPLEMDIDDISDYFLVKSGNQRHHGTKITLHLKDEVKEIFLKEELEHFARHIEIPITVVMASGERHIIGPRSDFKAYFRTGDLNSRLYMWSRKLECELFKGMIGILFEKEGERKKLASIRMHSDDCSVIYDKLYINQERFNPTFVDKAKGRLHIINPVINAVISCNGILVCIDRVIPKWLDDGSFFQDINIDKNSLDLSLSRDSIISNEKFEKISRLLEEKVIECFVALLEGLEFEDAKERNLFILAMCSRDYISEIDDEKYITSFRRYHEPLLNFFIKFYSFKCFTKEDANLKSYKEIINSKREIRLLDYIKNNNNEYIHQMLIKCDKLNSSNMYIMLEDHDLIRLLIMHSLNCFEINKLL